MLTLAAALILAPNAAWTQKLPTGVLSLVSVSDYSVGKSWAPDGSRQSTWVVPDLVRVLDGSVKSKERGPARIVFTVQFRPHDPSQVPSVAFKIGNQILPAGFTLLDQHDRKLWWSGASIDGRKLPSTVNVVVGIGAGSWKSSSTYNVESGAYKGPKFFGSILREPAVGMGTNPVVEMEATVPAKYAGKLAWRIKLFDIDGHSLQSAGSGPVKQGGEPRFFFVDNGKRIVGAVLYTEPYKWVTFKGVHTKPK